MCPTTGRPPSIPTDPDTATAASAPGPLAAQTKSRRRYVARGRVRTLNTCHAAGMRLAARFDCWADSKTAYSADPLPVKEAVSAPARISWRFTFASSGHLAKTNPSKSFSAGPHASRGKGDRMPKELILRPSAAPSTANPGPHKLPRWKQKNPGRQSGKDGREGPSGG